MGEDLGRFLALVDALEELESLPVENVAARGELQQRLAALLHAMTPRGEAAASSGERVR